MLNLNKRVNRLLEKTTSMECKSVCKEIIETYNSVPEEQLTLAIVEKLKTIQDADKHVASFIQTSEKYLGIKNLGLAKAISSIRESQSYHYPALRYSLDRFEKILVEGLTQDYLLVEDFMKTLKDFTWDKNVKDSLEAIREQYDTQKEFVLVAKSVFEFRKSKGNFIFERIVEKLEDHFENPTQASRSALIDELGKFTFNATAKQLLENLKRIQGANGGLQIIAENAGCDVQQVYSPLILENGKEYFTIKGDVYRKAGSLVEKVSSEELSSLSENIRRSHQVINSPYFFVKEGKAAFYIGRNKVEIFENESKKKVLFNGKEIPASDVAKNLVATGMVRLEEAKVASDIQFVSDIFENFFEIDFAKVISSKRYAGSYVSVMKIDNKIYMNKVNESMRTNEFFSDINASQARNIVLEFLGYDITESLTEFIEKEQAEIIAIKGQQSDLLKSMAIVESEITKLEAAKKDPYLANTPQVKELDEMLKAEITKLKTSYESLSAKLKKFEAKSSDAGVEIGEDIKITGTGELATVTSIDSNNKSVTVITASGKTVELPTDKIAPVEAEEAKAMEKNEIKGEKEAAKLAEEQLSIQSIGGGNNIPVEDPNKDDLQSQEEVVTVTDEENPEEYVTAVVAADQQGTCAGKEVKVLATDFTSKGPEDLLQVECDGELYFIEKKFLQVPTTEGDDSLSIDFDAEAPSDDEEKDKEEDSEEKSDDSEGSEEKSEEPAEDSEEKSEEPKEDSEEKSEEEPKEDSEEKSDDSEGDSEEGESEGEGESKDGEEKDEKPTVEELQAKLAKALEDLESIKDDLKDTFTSNEGVSTTINGLRGLIDAMKSETTAITEGKDILEVEDYTTGVQRINSLTAMVEATATGELKDNLTSILETVKTKFKTFRATGIESITESKTTENASSHLMMVMGFLDLSRVMEGLSTKYTEVSEDLKDASLSLKNGAQVVDLAIAEAMKK